MDELELKQRSLKDASHAAFGLTDARSLLWYRVSPSPCSCSVYVFNHGDEAVGDTIVRSCLGRSAARRRGAARQLPCD